MNYYPILFAFIVLSQSIALAGPNEALSNIQNMYLNDGTFMSSAEAKKMWGQEKFNSEIFKKQMDKRSPMAADLVDSKILIGKTIKEATVLLGAKSGYYWSEAVPTYLLNEGWKNNKDTWQIVLFMGNNQKVKEVRIHKNCCDK